MSAINRRAAAFSGIAFAVLFTIGLIFVGDVTSTTDDQKTLAWFADSANRREVIIGAYCLIVAVLCLIPFLIHLRDELASRTNSAPFASAVFASGLLFAGAAIGGAAAWAWIPAAVSFGGMPDVTNADVARMGPQLGDVFLLIGGGLAAFAMLGTASVAALKGHLWAPWIAWVGLVVAILQIADVMFLPYFLLVLWVLVASVTLLMRGRAAAALPAPQSA